MTPIADGLWRWTTFYGEWGQEVGCVYHETPDAVVLIDPLVPEEPREAVRFWKALDRDVKRARAPVHVLITVFWHTRSARAIAERYGADVHVQTSGRAAIARRLGLPGRSYRPGATLPGGVVSYPTPARAEVLFWIPAQRTLVSGDVLHGDGKRGLTSPWLSAEQKSRLPAALAPLLRLRVVRILSSHGQPLLRNGHAALAALADAHAPDGGAPSAA